MSDEKGYNGWTNYETWAVALWLGNERNHWTAQAQECWDESEATSVLTREEATAD